MDTAEQLRDKVDDPSTSMPPSLHNPDNLQGIYVYQLPFPGTLPEKAQREQLAAVVRKYSKIVEIRFDAVPNNPDVTSVQAGRRYQLPPLSRRALIVFQKTSIASYEALLAELNKQVMSQCHLSASTAKSEHISALIAMRNAASAGHNSTKAHQTMAAKNAQQNSTTATAAEPPSQQQQPQQLYSSKRPLTLLKIQPPAPAVKAFAMDSQTHTQPDPFHKNASRTLYVKHLDNTITEEELKVRYGKFGHILDIEVKNRNTMAPYAFIQFTNIESVANAIKAFNQQFEECGGARHKKFSNLHWWGNTIVTSRLWIGRLPPNCGEQYLMSKMRVVLTQPDDVTQVIYDAGFNEAIVMFVGHESTQIAFNKVKNRNITFQPERSSITEPVHHVHVDFCSEKLHDYFIDRLYGKNTESLLSDVILAPPPDPPKCLSSSHSQPKKSPSPPPDPSIESGGGHCASVIKRPIGRQKVLLVEQQQQNQGAGHAFEKILPNCNAKIGRTTRETTHSNSMAEETQSHREKTTRGKSQENSERGRSANVRQVRSNSSSSNTSTDTYSQSPRKRWRHPPQASEFNEFSGNRHKITSKKPAPETKHKWERKHRSQRSTERRRESRVEKREKRRERLRSRTRQTVGTARRTEGERSGDIASGGDRSKRGEHGRGKSTSEANKRSKTTSKVEKYKGRSNERVHTKTSSNSGSQLLPPPPVPPLRIDKTHDQHKRRRSTSSSSDSHSSCTCSSCSSNSSSNSRTNSLSENSDSELSSSENEAEQQHPSTRRSHRSRKDGFTDEPSQVGTRQPSIKRETPNAQSVHIKSEQVPLVTPIESKAIGTKNIVQNAERGNEKIVQNETKEENTEKSKDTKGDEQSKQRDQTASEKDETASKKTTVAAPSLPVQPPQTVGKVQVPRPSQRTVTCIPLDVQSTSSPPTDPRQMRPKQQRPTAVTESIMCLDLPRFVQKMRTSACNDNDRPSSSSISGEGANLTEELPKNSPLKTVPTTATDWIKHEPENAEMEPNLKTEKSNDGDVQVEKKPTAANTMNLMASITERIKCVENGITEFRNTVQVEQTNASSNFAQIELEVSRIRTELTNGIPLELLEHSIAQRSTITAQMNTSADGVGRQLQPKTTGDGFQTSNGQEFVSFTDETEKNKRNDETEVGGIHDRRCSFLSEPDMPTRSFSLSCDHHPTTSSANPMRLAHEKEQFASSANSLCASPLPKQSADSSSAFLRKPKQLADSQLNQTHARNTAVIPKLKEIKLDRKPSAVSLAVGGDPCTTTSVATSLSSLKKDKELKERREHRSDSVGHLPTTSAKDQRKELGVAKANVHLNLKKMTTATVRPQQKQLQKEERKTDSFVLFGGTSGGHSDEHKKQLKLAKLKHVETESASDAEKQHKKQKRKKRSTEQSTSSSSSDESLEESDMFNGIDIEEQKRMMKMIKSGIGFGLSMYDRVKRRSSQRPDDEQKKKTALEVLKTKHAKKRKEFSRVRLSSTSSDSEGNEYAQATTSAQLKMAERSSKSKSAEEDESDTSDEENGEQNAEENDDAMTRAEKPKTHMDTSSDMSTKSSADEKLEKTTAILTIRRPEIAPRKPFMDERPTKEEGANSSPSSVEEESVNGSESESEAEDGELDAGDRAIKKLKNVLSRYRKSSESSADEAKQFNEKLAKVISIATEGCQTHLSDSHSEKNDSSLDSSSSSESDTDSEPKKERLKGSAGTSKKLPSQKKVKHLSMEDVFGADSSEDSSGERAIPPPPLLRQNKVDFSSSTTKHKGVVNETIKKGIVVQKIKIGNKHEEAIKIRIGKEKAQNKSLLTTNEQVKRTRVSSVSSVSSVEQKRFKEAKSKPNAEKETVTLPPAITTTATSVRDRSKSDATAHHQQKLMTSNKSGTIDAVLRVVEKKAELDKKMKQQKPTKTTVGTTKVAIAKTTAKNSTFMKELAKRKIARNKEERKLDKRTALKRASGTDGKDQIAKKAKKETKPSEDEEKSNHSKEKDKKEREMPKEKQEEEVELAKPASETASQCLIGVSNTPKSAEDNEKVKQQQNISDKMDNEETEQKEQEEQREEEEAEKEGMKGKTETDELLNIVAAKQMADNEFEIIDSGKVEEGEETKRKQKEIEEERERKKREKEEKKLREQEKKREEEEKEKRKKEEHEEQKKRREQEKKREEEEEQKKREEEEKEKRKKEEHEEQTKRREQEKKREEEEEQKRRKEELRREEEKNREEEEKEKRRKEEHEEQKKRREQQKKREEEEEQKKREEEEKEKRRKEELEEQKKRREQEEEKQRKEEEEEKKKREEREANEVPIEEDDEEEMEAELLRRMEERNEEEAAVASLGLQTKADLRQPQDTNQPQIDAIEHDIGWKVLERPSEKEVKLEKVTEMVEEEKEKNMEEKVDECAVEIQIKCEQVEEETVSREEDKTANEEPPVDKSVGFKFETVERRASNESVDSHMAGVGNGFVEVDAEHLRQQKREQDALERLAEERRKTEETVKRMDETVDAVATNSALLQHQNQESTALIMQQIASPNVAQQQLTIDSFQRASQQQNAHQITTTTNGTFPQQREGVVESDYYYPTNMAMSGQAQNQLQQQREAVVQTVPVNAPITIQSQYIQQQPQHQQTVHSLQQQHFPLPSPAEDVLLTMSATSGASVSNSSVTTATTSYHPALVPTTVTSVHHQQQQQQQIFHHFGHGQLQQQQHFQQQPHEQQQQFPQLQQQEFPQQHQLAHHLQQQHPLYPSLPQQKQSELIVKQPQVASSSIPAGTASEQQQQKQPQTMASAMIAQQRKMSDIKLSQQQHHQTALAMAQPIQQNAAIGQPVQRSPIVHHQQQGFVDRRLLDAQTQQLQQVQQHQHQQQQHARIEQPQIQQRQQFQMQHIVQSPPIVPKQQQQVPSVAATTSSVQNQFPQQVQQAKQQNVSARQRKAQPQQVPTTLAQQQKQQPNISGQYPQQQEQQRQQHYQQQQLQPDTLSAMSTTGLMDHQSLVTLYQHLRDQQVLHQAQQMPSISAAMIAAASASTQFPPATLSKWHSIVTPPSSLAQGGALEEFLRHGLLAPQASSFAPSSGRGAESVGTSAMAAPTSFDELFQPKMSNTSSSPRAFPLNQPQMHQQILANVPQRNAAATNISHQQQQQQQTQQISGSSALNKQMHTDHQQRQPHQAVQQHAMLGQTAEKQHQLQQPIPQQMQQQILQHPIHQQQQQQMQQQHQIQQHQLAQQQSHFVPANVPLQPPPQHILPAAEPQQHQEQVQQLAQQKMVKKQSSANKYPVLWQGQLAMKNADTLVQMHKVCGNESLVQQMNTELSSVNENGIPLLRINQRMRLEHTHLENLIRKMEREDNQLALICLPCGRDREDVVIQTQKMNISFIEYFSSKSAAGIVSSGPTQQPSAMVAHIFPPSDFSRMLLSRNAPDLLRTVESLNAGYLFVILTNK